MRKKILCSMLALSVANLSLGYVNTVQASEIQQSKYNVGFQVVNYADTLYRQISEDTLFFASIENPSSYVVLPKGTIVSILGALFQDGNETTFFYVSYNGVEGYVDKQFVDLETDFNNAFSNGINTYTSGENAQSSGEKITISHKGVQMTLVPNGKGWYLDQDGIDRDAQGNPIDPTTGKPYDTSSTLHEANFTPIDQLPTNSGIKAE